MSEAQESSSAHPGAGAGDAARDDTPEAAARRRRDLVRAVQAPVGESCDVELPGECTGANLGVEACVAFYENRAYVLRGIVRAVRSSPGNSGRECPAVAAQQDPALEAENAQLRARVERLCGRLGEAGLAEPEICGPVRGQADRSPAVATLPEDPQGVDCPPSSGPVTEGEILGVIAQNPDVFDLPALPRDRMIAALVTGLGVEEAVSRGWPSALRDGERRDRAAGILCERIPGLCGEACPSPTSR